MTGIMTTNVETLTTTLRNGAVVLAKHTAYGVGAKTYANLTQAERAAAAIPGAFVRRFGRPFYVVIPESAA